MNAQPAIPEKLYYRIGEVEAITEVPAYVEWLRDSVAIERR